MRFLATITLIFLLGSCQQLLVPTWYTTEDHKLPTEKVENEWVAIYMENLEVEKDLLIFDVEVVNRSRHPLHFDPQKMYFYAGMNEFDELESLDRNWEERTSYRKHKPLDAETTANHYSQKIRSNKVAKGLIFLASAGLAAYTAATGSSGWIDPNSIGRNSQFIKDAAVTAGFFGTTVADNELAKKNASLREDLEYLPNEMLLETWIPAENSIRGKVYFQRDKNYRYYRMLVPIEDETFVYDMKVATSMESSLIKNLRKKNGYE